MDLDDHIIALLIVRLEYIRLLPYPNLTSYANNHPSWEKRMEGEDIIAKIRESVAVILYIWVCDEFITKKNRKNSRNSSMFQLCQWSNQRLRNLQMMCRITERMWRKKEREKSILILPVHDFAFPLQWQSELGILPYPGTSYNLHRASSHLFEYIILTRSESSDQ